MSKFAAKWDSYAVKLRSGSQHMEDGLVMRKEPVFARFDKGIFDTNSEQVESMPLTEKQVLTTLRKHKQYGSNFYELNRNPKTAVDLTECSIKDLQDIINEVSDAAMLKEALQLDDRNSAEEIYERRLRQL